MSSNDNFIKIEKIWTDILGLKAIGHDDDFFSLGGNSLHAIAIIAEINKQLNCQLTMKDLFFNDTILQLTQLVKSKI